MKKIITFIIIITVITIIIFISNSSLKSSLVTPSSVPVSTPVPTPKLYQFDEKTDLKMELDSINPEVSDSDFEKE